MTTSVDGSDMMGVGAEPVRGRAAAETLFAGRGEVRALARTLDWGATPLGWPDAWSTALRIATAAMLEVPFPICLWSGPHYALVYNDAYRRILAAKHPTALGQPGSAVWAEIWEGLSPQFAQVSAGGPAVHGEDARFVMARLAGGGTEDAWFSYSLSALRDEDGAVVAIYNISPETTARVRAEQALEAERERLRTVILSMPSPLALHLGPEHRFELVNAAFRRISGGGRDDTGKTVREAFPELPGQGIIEALDRVYATGEPWIGAEIPIRYDRDGTGLQDTWYNVRYEPVRDPQGAVIGVLNFAVEVTDQVRARQQVERLLAESQTARADAESARAAAEAANQAKGEFLANMSHELRTPLNAIGGYVELMELGLHGPVTDEQRLVLGRVQGAQHRLLALINDVLNYAKLEGGRVEYDTQLVDVREVVAEVGPLVAPQLAGKGLAFDVRLSDTSCVVWADREKLGQVLLNLLSNAVKFTEARHPETGVAGRVTVDVAAREGRADAVFLRVTDTGRGIPRAKQDAIFEPFVQVQTGYARATEGTGLGLAISRDLTRGMGGELRVRSREGEGATFTVALRRAVTAEGQITDRRTVDERREEERRAAEDRRHQDALAAKRAASGRVGSPPARTPSTPRVVDV